MPAKECRSGCSSGFDRSQPVVEAFAVQGGEDGGERGDVGGRGVQVQAASTGLLQSLFLFWS
jgi:hypothetical protein